MADMFPQVMETAYGQEDLEREMKNLQADAGGSPTACGALDVGFIPERSEAISKGPIPVFNCRVNLDIRNANPLEGAAWLIARVRAKMTMNGRMDIDFIILEKASISWQ